MKNVWRKVWVIPTQPPVRNLLWRACRRILPCCDNLFKRKVTNHNTCDVCNVVEGEYHALFRCREALRVWRKVPEFKGVNMQASDVLSLFDHVHANSIKDQVQVWVYIVEAVWNARNKRIFEGTKLDLSMLLDNTFTLVSEFREVVKVDAVVPLPPVAENMKWLPPEAGFLKINYDAAMSDLESCGIGCIANNERGETVFFVARSVAAHIDVEVIEAKSLVWGLEISLDRGFDNIWMESDCLPLIKKLLNGRPCKDELGSLFKMHQQLGSILYGMQLELHEKTREQGRRFHF